MVLYGKSGDFIGIGKEELSFLGFDDIDEFKNEYKDFADLFVNKPGYIFNFKNFSWIDYTLHSGAPKKTVVLKLKNGQEVEANLKINELFLKNPTNKEDLYYCVEIANTSLKNAFQTSEQESTIPNVIMKPSFTPAPIVEIVQNEIAVSEYVPEAPTEEVVTRPLLSEEPVSFSLEEDFSDNTQGEPDFKLKFDHDILDEPKVEKEEEPLEDLSIDFKVEESFDAPVNLSPMQEDIKLKIDFDEPIIEKEKNQVAFEIEDEIINFDIVECAENLGLDLGEIAQILEDFIEKVDSNISVLKTCIQTQDMRCVKEIVLSLKGISDTLQIQQFSKYLSTIIKTSDINEIENALLSFERLVNQLKKELI